MAPPGKYRTLHLLIITSMVTALLIGPITVVKLTVPSGPWRILPLIVFFVALEGGLTTWWLGRQKRRVNHIFYRISEIILLLVALRMSTWIGAGNLPNLATIRSFIIFPSQVVDIIFVIFVLLALFAWERSITFSSTFDKLILSPEEVTYYTLPTAERLQSGISVVPKNRIQLQHDFLRQWVIGGIILVFFAVITTFDLPEPSVIAGNGINIRNIGRLGLRSDILLVLILYFIGGLWLTSLSRMHILQARWLTTGLPAESEIMQLWRTRGLLLILILGIVAAFLPIGSSFAFSRIVVAIFSLVAIAFGLFLILITYLLYLVSSLFGVAVPDAPPPPPVDLSQFSQEIEQTGSASNFINIILGSIFWLGIVSIVIIALYFFLRDRGSSLEGTRVNQPWQAFITWLKNLWNKAKSRSTSLSFPWKVQFKTSKAISDERILPWKFIRINALSPRDQIIYFYLSIVKRAGKKGVGRAPGKTPSEYASDLKAAWPEANSDIRYLTEQFQDARYNADPIDEDKPSFVRESFKRVRSTLRHRKTE
jgi:hypothetical protein